jgi:hypothetical protein
MVVPHHMFQIHSPEAPALEDILALEAMPEQQEAH